MKRFSSILSIFNNYKKIILTSFFIFSLLGVVNMSIDNYLTDEVNDKSELYKEINYFEKYFGGIKPLSFTIINSTEKFSSDFVDFLEKEKVSVDIVFNRADTTLIKARIKDIGAIKSKELYERIKVFSDEYKTTILLGGVGYLFDQISNDLTFEVLIGLVLAILLIGVIFVVLNNFNIRYLFVSLVPNLVPMLSCLGVLSLFGFYLSLSNAFIFAIIFGLIVDDSIHIISAYSINRKAKKSIEGGLIYCRENTFHAVIKTTLVIIVSLLPLLFSEFKSISQLAYITIISAVFALIFDFIFLPILLRKYIK